MDKIQSEENIKKLLESNPEKILNLDLDFTDENSIEMLLNVLYDKPELIDLIGERFNLYNHFMVKYIKTICSFKQGDELGDILNSLNNYQTKLDMREKTYKQKLLEIEKEYNELHYVPNIVNQNGTHSTVASIHFEKERKKQLELLI